MLTIAYDSCRYYKLHLRDREAELVDINLNLLGKTKMSSANENDRVRCQFRHFEYVHIRINIVRITMVVNPQLAYTRTIDVHTTLNLDFPQLVS